MEVGQQARLHLDVLSRDGWAQIKRVPDLEVAGALIHALRRARAHRLTRTANLTYCSGPHLAPLNPACTRQAATASSR